MATRTMRGKCPNCCPDGGAVFTPRTRPVGGWDSDSSGWESYKKCNNCGHEMPLRKVNRNPAGPNARQQRAIALIAEAFGGEHETRMMGRDVWISARNYEGRKFFDGQSLFGTIGPRGAMDITLQRPFGDKQIKDNWDVRNYLMTRTDAERDAERQRLADEINDLSRFVTGVDLTAEVDRERHEAQQDYDAMKRAASFEWRD